MRHIYSRDLDEIYCPSHEIYCRTLGLLKRFHQWSLRECLYFSLYWSFLTPENTGKEITLVTKYSFLFIHFLLFTIWDYRNKSFLQLFTTNKICFDNFRWHLYKHNMQCHISSKTKLSKQEMQKSTLLLRQRNRHAQQCTQLIFPMHPTWW